MQLQRLIKKSSLYFLGNLSSKALSVLLLPIYAFYIQTNDLGYYDYIQTTIGLFSPIVFFSIWEAILRFLLYEPDVLKQKKIITTSMIFVLFMAGLFTLIMHLYGTITDSKPQFFLFVISMFVISSLAQIWQYYARAMGENKLYVVSGVAGTVINFFFLSILVCGFKYGLIGLYVASVLGQLSILLTIEGKMHIVKNVNMRYFDVATLKSMLLFSIPLVFNLVLAWLLSNFGRILITYKLGTEMNGLFSFANKFSMLISIVASMVTMAIIEEAIINAKTLGIDSDFSKAIETVFKLFLTLTMIAIPMVTIFYSFIQNTAYSSSLGYALWLLICAALSAMASNVGAIFQAINRTQYQFITTAIGATVSVGVSCFLITFISIYAVVIGQILGALVMLLSRCFFVNRYMTFKINWEPILGMGVVCISTLVICLHAGLIVNFIIFTAIIAMTYYFQRKSWKAIWIEKGNVQFTKIS